MPQVIMIVWTLVPLIGADVAALAANTMAVQCIGR